MTRDPSALWRRLQRGWPAAYPLVQFPNAPLLAGIVASLAARPVDGDLHDVLVAVSRIGVVVWAYEELVRGDNAFRRLLGAAALAYLAVAISGVAG